MAATRRTLKGRLRPAALFTAGIVVGALLLSPVGAHVGKNVGHLWRKHIKPRVLAGWYTKAQSDARFIDTGEQAADADTVDGMHASDLAYTDAEAVAAILAGDGAGSGLDADLLDGMESSEFAIGTHDHDSVYALLAHTHPGSDITSAVASAEDANTLDGLDSTDFVRHSGLVLVNSSAREWLKLGAWAGRAEENWRREATWARFLGGGISQDMVFTLQPEIPVALYGKRLRFLGAELCYDATDAGPVVDAVILNVYTNANDVGGSPTTSQTDGTDRDDEACRVYLLSSPVELTADNTVTLQVQVDWVDAGDMLFGRTTFVLGVTGTTASAP